MGGGGGGGGRDSDACLGPRNQATENLAVKEVKAAATVVDGRLISKRLSAVMDTCVLLPTPLPTPLPPPLSLLRHK